jgi:hypothetical protein
VRFGMPNPNDKQDQDIEDDDTVGVRAPDLSDDSEDAVKGDDSIELDPSEAGEDDLDDGVLDDDKGVDG